MTDPRAEPRDPTPEAEELVMHKGTRECPMLEPHPRAACGIVQARERNREAADAARRGSRKQ